MPQACSDGNVYEQFARFYDRAEGDAPVRFAEWVLATVASLPLTVRGALELGVGTGAVLERMPSTWERTGVDLSPEMLAEARAKGIDARFIESDVRNLALGRSFDLVYCVFDTINHLPGRAAWIDAFRAARAHTAEGGAFLVDMNTRAKLQALVRRPPMVADLDEDTVIIDVHEALDGSFDWDIRVFEADGEVHRLHREHVSQVAFPIVEVRSMLNNAGFDVVDVTDGRGGEATEDSLRAFFVCRPLRDQPAIHAARD